MATYEPTLGSCIVFSTVEIGIEVGRHRGDGALRQVLFVLVAEDDVAMAVMVFCGGSCLRPFEAGEGDQIAVVVVLADG